jgi:hypothetical protein
MPAIVAADMKKAASLNEAATSYSKRTVTGLAAAQ